VPPAQIDFAVPEYKAPEDIGELEITLLKTGGDSDVRVIVETQDGSAKAGVKYKALKHYAIDFEGENAPGEVKEQTFKVEIINTADKEDLLDFTVAIVGVRGHAVEGPTDKAHVQIVDTTEKGKLVFAQPYYNVADYLGKAVVTVSRENGSSGDLECTLTAKDGTAKSGTHYAPFEPKTLTFSAGEMSKTHTISLMDLDNGGDATNTNFKLELSGPNVDPNLKTSIVTIVDGDINDVVSKVARLMQVRSATRVRRIGLTVPLCSLLLLPLKFLRELAEQCGLVRRRHVLVRAAVPRCHEPCRRRNGEQYGLRHALFDDWVEGGVRHCTSDGDSRRLAGVHGGTGVYWWLDSCHRRYRHCVWLLDEYAQGHHCHHLCGSRHVSARHVCVQSSRTG
jgi:hypothetical protein